MTESHAPATLAEACTSWQGGRNLGSSLLRGAARAITGLPHYFSADYIDGYEKTARSNTVALDNARVLLAALASAPLRTADEWNAELALPATGFAGRGLAGRSSEDQQIAEILLTGEITMPLWGVSLSRAVADSFGNDNLRWIFQIVGPFPAVPAWTHSGIKAEEQELICGGRYRVQSTTEEGTCTRVDLSYKGPALHES